MGVIMNLEIIKFILKYSSRKRIFVMLLGMTALLCVFFYDWNHQIFSFMIWLIIGILLILGISNF